jgi:alkaline phosphatase D
MFIKPNETFIKSIITMLLVFCFSSLGLGQEAHQIIGPLVGHTDTNSTNIWARSNSEGQYILEVKQSGRKIWEKFISNATSENDFCMTWEVKNLIPATRYQYRIKKGPDTLAQGDNLSFKTAPLINSKTQVHVAFGSGTNYVKGTGEVWNRIAKSNIDAMVLLGDTPYIDTTELGTQRNKYREFSSFAEFRNLAQTIPFWGTWDDHDFAFNDSDGRAAGKGNSLKAF